MTCLHYIMFVNMKFAKEDRIFYFFFKYAPFRGRPRMQVAERSSKQTSVKRGIYRLLKQVRDTGTIDKLPGSGRCRSARTNENVELVNDFVLSQEDAPWTRRTVRQFSKETVWNSSFLLWSHRTPVHDTDEQKQRLIQTWVDVPQSDWQSRWSVAYPAACMC